MYYVYFMSNKKRNVLYVGVTNNLVRRVFEHENSLVEGFTKRYKTYDLVYFEETECIEAAIAREKEIKKWRRVKKDALIAEQNPELKRLNEEILN